MLPPAHQIAFLLFAIVTLAVGFRGFYRVILHIRRGTQDVDARRNHIFSRIRYAAFTALTQRRMFPKRPIINILHSFIFYGFLFYLLVNLVDAVAGFAPLDLASTNFFLATFNLLADTSTLLVLVGAISLILRRFLLPGRRDFSFNPRTLIHSNIVAGKIRRDSMIVSAFIVFHVTCRALGEAARISETNPNRFQPLASLLAHLIPVTAAASLRLLCFWGSLGSILVFLAYFPYTKHIHIFMAPAKYLFKRESPSGVLPTIPLSLDSASGPPIGANKLEDLAWPRLLDAYACIQCNRCQDVCPASATGKALSPSAIEINKRMELNELVTHSTDQKLFEQGAPSPHSLLEFALSEEAAWACTTCGACMEVCPVENEPMLDIIDVRRQQVMLEGRFPSQLQTAFKGIERNQNPWGISAAKRLAWADGLKITTIEENPHPHVLYWVGCAASFDPSSQKTARAVVELLNHAGISFAVLGKRESCTGDVARRAGNEVLYQELASGNIKTLDEIAPKVILTSCPHCMNTLGREYRDLGGNYKVMHHTEYLDGLITEGPLSAAMPEATITYHDPCYLGRHQEIYDAPRNLLRVLGQDFVELGRTREQSFCCGAGGAQFWKEEETGNEAIASNRLREVKQVLGTTSRERVLAVACPFCKSMLQSSHSNDPADFKIMDVAELLRDRVVGISSQPTRPISNPAQTRPQLSLPDSQPSPASGRITEITLQPATATEAPLTKRKKWQPPQKSAEEKTSVYDNVMSTSGPSDTSLVATIELTLTSDTSDGTLARGLYPVAETSQFVACDKLAGNGKRATPRVTGGSFLISACLPEECFFPEDFTAEQRQIANVTNKFAADEVMAVSNEIENKDFPVIRRLMKEAAKLGLTAVDVPEEYGGLALDKVTSAIVTENMAIQGSFSVAFSGHVGIGTLPIIWYGTPAQKAKYLHRLADATLIGAYALSEADSGSDALGARARAVLSEDGNHYVLNGEKMWTTNAGFADLFTVFAKCLVKEGRDAGSEKLTTFLIEKDTPGFSIGREEHKLGIRGSSTCPLILSNCIIPKENLLGEVGKGHQIAFNILNVGRYKLGNSALGAARVNLNRGIEYAKERKAFGKPISEFGMIQEKLADGAIGVFVGEALVYRTVGHIDAALIGIPKGSSEEIQRAIEAYAAECSIAKVWTSEMHDHLIDDILQIYGGYGFVEDYPIERAYRDSRINRIFEGTNEINRLIITSRILKASSSGRLNLNTAIDLVLHESESAPISSVSSTADDTLANIKKIAVLCLGLALKKYGDRLIDQQEVIGSISNMLIEIYASESAQLRVSKISEKPSTPMHAIAEIYLEKTMEMVESLSRNIITEIVEEEHWERYLLYINQLTKRKYRRTISLKRTIAMHLLQAGRYPFYI
jgi:alkylation response protein AidB-like acyl-CoA dehydrogenase/Fe-S oxidoreductase